MRTMRRQDIVPVVNRTLRPLEVTDDGISIVLKPGYRRLEDGRVVGAGRHGEPEMVYLPEATAFRAKNQNKQRGTVNPDDPLDCEFLIGLADRDDVGFLDDQSSPDDELIDRSMLPEAQRAQRINTGVGRRRSRRDRHIGTGVTPTPAGVMALENGNVRTGVEGLVGGQQPFVDVDS